MRNWLLVALVAVLVVDMHTYVFAAALSSNQCIRLGRQALLNSRPDAARRYFVTALDLLRADPHASQSNKIPALSGLGYADLWLGQELAARRAYEEGLRLAQTPEDKKAMRLGLGRALNGLGQSQRAYQLLQDDTSSSNLAALQAAAAAHLLGWNTRAENFLAQAASNGKYVGPEWQKRLYDQISNDVAFAVKPNVNSDFQYNGDNDHNTSQTYQVGVTYPGPGLGDNALSPTLWDAHYQQILLSNTAGSSAISIVSAGVAAPLSHDWSYSVQVGLGNTAAWTFGTVTSNLSYQPSDYFGLELGVDRQPVKSIQSVRNRIMLNTLNLGGFATRPGVGTFSASYFNEDFNDGNDRNGFIMRITPAFYSFSSAPINLGVQGFYRYYTSGKLMADGYFNPRHYSETIGYLIYEQKFGSNWTLKIHAGLGSQTVNGTSTPVKDFYGSVIGSVSRHFQIGLKGGYSQIASFIGGGSGYIYSYAQANISVPF